jgi:hypothetical protein
MACQHAGPGVWPAGGSDRADLIFWVLLYQDKSTWAPRPRAGQAKRVKAKAAIGNPL